MVTSSPSWSPSTARLRRTLASVLCVLAAAATVGGCASADCKAGQSCDDPGTDTAIAADTLDATADLSDVDDDADVAENDGDTTAVDGDGDTTATDGTDAGDDADVGTDTMPMTCLPNGDGTIERAEVPLRTGVNARFRVAEDVDNLDLQGIDDNGTPTWDLSPMFNATEHLELGELRALDGQWFEDGFPDATYFTAFSSDYFGVFQATPDALLLLGIVSPTDDFPSTEITYDPPVAILQFPLRDGDSWEASTTATGTLEGFAAFYTEDYTFSVDARGDLVTPFATFDVLRVNSELEQWVGAAFTSRRTVAFVTECFGTVATITSTDYEDEVDFTRAASVRRLAP